MRLWILPLTVMIFLTYNRPVFAAEPPLILDELIIEALAANPQISAARHQARAAGERVPQAGALEDPMLGVGIVNLTDELDFGQEEMTMKEVSVSQTIPLFGKRALRREAAQEEADALKARADQISVDIEKEVKMAFYDLSHVHRANATTQRNKTILEDLSRLAQSRYAVGQGTQEELIRVRVDISRMVDDLLRLEQRRRSLEARMHQLLNRSAPTPLGPPEEFDHRTHLDRQALQAAALDHNPELRAMRGSIQARHSTLNLARRDLYPDITVKVAWGQRQDRPDLYTAEIEAPIPVFAGSKQNRKIEERLADLQAEQAGLEAKKNDIFYMITDLCLIAQRLERQIDLYTTGILPQSRAQIESALSNYTVNRADFMGLLDSRMRLYRYELDYHELRTDQAKTVAALEALVGTRLESERSRP